jgi:hypothetical protein
VLEVTAGTKVLEKGYVNMTPLGQLMEGVKDLFRFDPKNIGKYVEGKISELFKYDVSDASLDQGGSGFRYVGEYEGKPVYAASNGVIGRLLDQYGDPGHKSGKINYGAAFKDRIIVNDVYVDSAAYSGKADPFASRKLQYILEHELAELKGLGHEGAHESAEAATNLSRNMFENRVRF